MGGVHRLALHWGSKENSQRKNPNIIKKKTKQEKQASSSNRSFHEAERAPCSHVVVVFEKKGGGNWKTLSAGLGVCWGGAGGFIFRLWKPRGEEMKEQRMNECTADSFASYQLLPS